MDEPRSEPNRGYLILITLPIATGIATLLAVARIYTCVIIQRRVYRDTYLVGFATASNIQAQYPQEH